MVIAGLARRGVAKWGLWVGTLGLFGCDDGDASGDRPVIEIGILVEQTDSVDTQQEVSELLVVVRTINAQGGVTIDGIAHDLDIVSEDHGGSADTAVQALDRLARRGVTAVVGPPWSSLALGNEADFSDGVSLAARRLDTLLVSPTATAPAISTLDDDDLQWRTVPSDAFQAALAAEEIIERGLTLTSVLYRDEAWGQAFTAAFSDAYEDLGGTVISTVGYDASGEEIVDLKAYDFDDELDQVFAEQPEAILLLNFDEVFQVTSRIASRGDLESYTTPPLFFGSDANFTEDLLTNAAPEVLESMVGIAPLTDADSEGYQRFAALAEDAGVDLTESSAPARYDAAFLIALAMESAGSDASGAMKVVLQQVSKDDPGDVTIFADDWAAAKEAIAAGQGIDYEGASGPIEFDDNGDITSGVYVVWKVMPSGAGAFAFDLDETVAYDAVGTFTRSGDGGASSDE